ncbi:MAG: FG-GAP repeat domain-containing protein [Candidatus Bipolaricaulaceae bacterium]
MKGKRAVGVLVAVALAVGIGGVSPGQAVPEFGGALPLWEPEGLPVLLLPGATMFPPADQPRAMVVADIDGDGRAELIVGGDYLHVLSLRDGAIARNYLTASVGGRSAWARVGCSLGFEAWPQGTWTAMASSTLWWPRTIWSYGFSRTAPDGVRMATRFPLPGGC